MSQLLQLRAAVVAGIKAALPAFEVEGHLGRFTAADLNQFLMAAPAIRVAILGLTDSQAIGEEGEEIAAVAKVAIYVVTKDVGKRLSRDQAAMAAVERICLLASGNRWGLSFAQAADAPTGSNLFSGETLQRGVALWAIDLPQPVRLWMGARDGEPQPPEMPELRQLFIGIAPQIGAAHAADYIGPFPEAGSDD